MGLEGFQFFRRRQAKTQKTQKIFVSGSARAYGTRALKLRAHLLKTAWTLGPFRGTRANSGIASEVLTFSIKSILGVEYDLILITLIQIFGYLRETLYKDALDHLVAARSEEKYEKEKEKVRKQAPDYY